MGFVSSVGRTTPLKLLAALQDFIFIFQVGVKNTVPKLFFTLLLFRPYLQVLGADRPPLTS